MQLKELVQFPESQKSQPQILTRETWRQCDAHDVYASANFKNSKIDGQKVRRTIDVGEQRG